MQEDGDAMSRHRKRPTVMPEGASYGTAGVSAGIQTSERPIGNTPKPGAETRVWTERMLAALAKGSKHVLGPAEGRTRGAASGTA